MKKEISSQEYICLKKRDIKWVTMAVFILGAFMGWEMAILLVLRFTG